MLLVRPLAAIALASSGATAQVSNAPRIAPDITAYVTPFQLKQLDEKLKPHVDRARATFPAIRDRFLAGLPKGEALYVTARLYDERTWSELAPIRVISIRNGIIEGQVWSTPKLMDNYRFRDYYGFPEFQLIDWSLSRLDGTEEGNFVASAIGR